MRRKDGCTYIWLTNYSNTVTVAYCHRPRAGQDHTVTDGSGIPLSSPTGTHGQLMVIFAKCTLPVLGTPRVPTKFWVPQQDSVRRQLTFAGYPTGTHKVLGPSAGLCPQTANIRWVPHGYPQSSGSPSRRPTVYHTLAWLSHSSLS